LNGADGGLSFLISRLLCGSAFAPLLFDIAAALWKRAVRESKSDGVIPKAVSREIL
jgi:hypothetical protein